MRRIVIEKMMHNRVGKIYIYVFLLGLFITTIIAYLNNQTNNKEKNQLFDKNIQIIEKALVDRLEIYKQVLISGTSIFEIDSDVSRNDWNIFVARKDILVNFPGIQGIGYSEIIQPGKLDKFENSIRQEGFKDFKVKPEGRRDVYSAIKYLEPFDDRNKRAFGYDMYSENVRHEAMYKAIISGKPQLSGKVRLVQENGIDEQAGFLLYVPVYQKNTKLNSVEDRKKAIAGFVYAPFRAKKLFSEVVKNIDYPLRLKIYDTDKIDKSTLLFDSNKSFDSFVAITKIIHITVDGREWTLEFNTPAKQFGFWSNMNTIAIFSIGTLFSFFVSLLLYYFQNINKRANEIADEITKELKNEQDRLKNISDTMLEALYVTDEKGGITMVNSFASKLLGYQKEEMIGQSGHYLFHYHSENSNIPISKCPIYKAVADNEDFYGEQVFKRKNGSLFAVEVSAHSLKKDGKLIGEVVTFKDITELKESKNNLLRLLEFSPIAVRIAAKNGKEVIFSNKAYESLTETENPIGINPKDYYADEDEYEKIVTCVKNGESIQNRLVKLNINGKIKYALASYMPFVFEKTDVVLGWFFDISESVALQQAVEKERDFIATVFEASHAVMAVIDKNGVMIRMNHKAEEVTGYSKEEVSAEPYFWSRFLDVKEKDDVIRMFQTALVGNSKVRYINDWVSRDGNRLTFDWSNALIKNENGETEYLITVGIDITEQRKSEAKLLLQERAFYQVGQGVLITDKNRLTVYANKGFERITGYSVGEIIGKNCSILQGKDTDRSLVKHMRSKLDSAEAFEVEIVNYRKNGEAFWNKLSVVPVFDDMGAVVNFIGTQQDITQTKFTQQELIVAKERAEESTKSKSLFLANMSHEIRTPMNAVIGLSSLAMTSNSEKERIEYIEKINSSSRLLLGIINDILDYSKIEAGKLKLESSVFDIDDILSELISIFQRTADEKHLELYFYIQKDTPRTLVGDQLRLTQVFVNLIGNALKFTHKGYVKLSILPKDIRDDSVLLSFEVEDTGVGMDNDTLSKLFTPFMQADVSTTRKYGGTGLGLVITKKIIEAFGSDITVISKPDKGSRFGFDLNLNIAKDVRPKNICPEFAETKNAIVADDDDTTRIIISELLRRCNMQVYEARDGVEAIAMILNFDKEGKKFDFAIIDYQMPILNGSETIEKIESLRRSGALSYDISNIMMISTFEAGEIASKDLNVKQFLSKPISPSSLFDAIVSIEKTYEQDRMVHMEKNGQDSKSLSGMKILLVEDNEINQVVATRMLERLGADVDTANNGQEGVERASDYYNIVLMDIQMPIMGGYEASQIIKKNYPYLPIIALTAAASEEDRQKAADMGMDGYTSKPIDIAELENVIVRLTSGVESKTNINISKEDDTNNNGIMNLKLLLEDLGNDKNILKKVANTFMIDLTQKFNNLPLMIRERTPDAASLIHALKGVSGNVRATNLYEVISQIDKAYKEDREIAEDLILRLENEIENVKSLLLVLLDGE